MNASKGGGNALAPEVRAFMEPRFGADFSAVRVHTGGEAVQMNRQLGAQAFAHGSDVYFGEGKEPGNNELMAHELTHVVQQNGDVVQAKQNTQPEETHNDKQNVDAEKDPVAMVDNCKNCDSNTERNMEITELKPPEILGVTESLQREQQVTEGIDKPSKYDSENFVSDPRTKAKRSGPAGVITLDCIRARQNTFVYGKITSNVEPILQWFVEFVLSDGRTIAKTQATLPTWEIKFDIKYERPLSWAQVKTAWIVRPITNAKMVAQEQRPLETSCPSSRNDENS